MDVYKYRKKNPTYNPKCRVIGCGKYLFAKKIISAFRRVCALRARPEHNKIRSPPNVFSLSSRLLYFSRISIYGVFDHIFVFFLSLSLSLSSRKIIIFLFALVLQYAVFSFSSLLFGWYILLEPSARDFQPVYYLEKYFWTHLYLGFSSRIIKRLKIKRCVYN